jgi:hypothetical protein
VKKVRAETVFYPAWGPGPFFPLGDCVRPSGKKEISFKKNQYSFSKTIFIKEF